MEETNLISKEIFSKFNEHLDAEQVVREKIREMVRFLDQVAKESLFFNLTTYITA